MLTIALVLSLSQSPEDVMREIQRSHIEANVPADADFERLLQRDLDKFFKARRPNPFRLKRSRSGAAELVISRRWPSTVR